MRTSFVESYSVRMNHHDLSQFRRWFQFYERPQTVSTLARQLEILAPDARIHGSTGKVMNGRDEYVAGLAELPADVRNAHHVLGTTVDDDGNLTAEIRYQAKHPDDSVITANLHYEVTFTDGLISSIVMTLVDTVDAEFVDAYPENRAAGFMYRWLHLIEKGDPDPFDELVPDEFTLDFTSTTVTNRQDLVKWVVGTTQQVRSSHHRPEKLTISVPEPDRYDLDVEFDWDGVSVEGVNLIARTHHQWRLRDTGERYCRLEHAKVDAIVPFQPA